MSEWEEDEVYELADEVLVEPTLWFELANPRLDGERPFDLMDTSAGRAKVAALIEAIADGVFL